MENTEIADTYVPIYRQPPPLHRLVGHEVSRKFRATLLRNPQRAPAKRLFAAKKQYIEYKMALAALLKRSIEFIERRPQFTIEDFRDSVGIQEWDKQLQMIILRVVEKYIKNSQSLSLYLRQNGLEKHPDKVFRHFTKRDPEEPVSINIHGMFLHLETHNPRDFAVLYRSQLSAVDLSKALEQSIDIGGFYRCKNATCHGKKVLEDFEFALIGLNEGSKDWIVLHEHQHHFFQFLQYKQFHEDRSQDVPVNTPDQLRTCMRMCKDEVFANLADELIAKVRDGTSAIDNESFLLEHEIYFMPNHFKNELSAEVDDSHFLAMHGDRIHREEIVRPYMETAPLLIKIALEIRKTNHRLHFLFGIEPAESWPRLYRWLQDCGYISREQHPPLKTLADRADCSRRFYKLLCRLDTEE